MALLGYNGFVIGSVTVGAMAARGAVETLTLLVPHAIVELPALWLAGAVGLRVSHGLWKAAAGEESDASGPRLLAEVLLAYGVALAMLALAAVVEAQVTPAVFRALT